MPACASPAFRTPSPPVPVSVIAICGAIVSMWSCAVSGSSGSPAPSKGSSVTPTSPCGNAPGAAAKLQLPSGETVTVCSRVAPSASVRVTRRVCAASGSGTATRAAPIPPSAVASAILMRGASGAGASEPPPPPPPPPRPPSAPTPAMAPPPPPPPPVVAAWATSPAMATMRSETKISPVSEIRTSAAGTERVAPFSIRRRIVPSPSTSTPRTPSRSEIARNPSITEPRASTGISIRRPASPCPSRLRPRQRRGASSEIGAAGGGAANLVTVVLAVARPAGPSGRRDGNSHGSRGIA